MRVEVLAPLAGVLSVSVVEGYRGLVFEHLGERQTIPVIQPDTQGLEYDITMAIKRL